MLGHVDFVAVEDGGSTHPGFGNMICQMLRILLDKVAYDNILIENGPRRLLPTVPMNMALVKDVLQ